MASKALKTDVRLLGSYMAVYMGSALVGATLGLDARHEPALWPPAGILVGFLLLNKARAWPLYVAVTLPLEMIARLWLLSTDPVVAVASAIALSLASVAGVGAIRSYMGTFRVVGLRETLALLAVGLVIGPVTGAALFGGLLIVFGQSIDLASILERCTSEATGVLAFAPLTIVVWRPHPAWRSHTPTQWAKLIAMLLIAVAIGDSAFRGAFPFPYILLPSLLWASIRMEMLGAASFSVVIAVIAISHTVSGRGIFVDPQYDLRERLWLAQLYVLATGSSALIVAAVTRGRQRALEAVQFANAALERRVAERTLALQTSEERLRMALDAAKMKAFEFSPRTDERAGWETSCLSDANRDCRMSLRTFLRVYILTIEAC